MQYGRTALRMSMKRSNRTLLAVAEICDLLYCLPSSTWRAIDPQTQKPRLYNDDDDDDDDYDDDKCLHL